MKVTESEAGLRRLSAW